jgi:hypothetical protein
VGCTNPALSIENHIPEVGAGKLLPPLDNFGLSALSQEKTKGEGLTKGRLWGTFFNLSSEEDQQTHNISHERRNFS